MIIRRLAASSIGKAFCTIECFSSEERIMICINGSTVHFTCNVGGINEIKDTIQALKEAVEAL